VVVPVPVVVLLEVPLLVNVQVPVAGKPLNVRLPAANAQVGWVIVPTVGMLGVAGCAFTTALAEAREVQAPKVAVTV